MDGARHRPFDGWRKEMAELGILTPDVENLVTEYLSAEEEEGAKERREFYERCRSLTHIHDLYSDIRFGTRMDPVDHAIIAKCAPGSFASTAVVGLADGDILFPKRTIPAHIPDGEGCCTRCRSSTGNYMNFLLHYRSSCRHNLHPQLWKTIKHLDIRNPTQEQKQVMQDAVNTAVNSNQCLFIQRSLLSTEMASRLGGVIGDTAPRRVPLPPPPPNPIPEQGLVRV